MRIPRNFCISKHSVVGSGYFDIQSKRFCCRLKSSFSGMPETVERVSTNFTFGANASHTKAHLSPTLTSANLTQVHCKSKSKQSAPSFVLSFFFSSSRDRHWLSDRVFIFPEIESMWIAKSCERICGGTRKTPFYTWLIRKVQLLRCTLKMEVWTTETNKL